MELCKIDCFFLALGMLTLLLNCDSLGVAGGDSLPLGASLSANRTIISKNGTFELGFFSPNGTNNWYIGIWYAQISDKPIVWVANRETPIRNMSGVLKLSTDGYLSLSDLQGREFWSSNENQQAKASRAVILDSGNFVMLGAQNTSEIVWESFRHPTDTFLPTMKFWKGMKVISWKSSVDPAPGPFLVEMNPSPEKTDMLLHYKDGPSYWTSGDWTGSYYSNLPGDKSDSIFVEEFVRYSPTSMYYTYWLIPKPNMMMGREIVSWNGELLFYFWIDNSRWSMISGEPQLQCGVYGQCGAYGVCYINNKIQSCTCMQGFQPRDRQKSEEWWSSGCVRRSPLRCSATNGTTDGFVPLRDNVSLSAEKAVEYNQQTTVQGCKTACLNNCSCTAFAFIDSSPPVCRLWFGDLLSVGDSSDHVQRFFIRLAASDLQQANASDSQQSNGKSRVVALSISLPVGFAVLVLVISLFVQRRRRRLLQKYRERHMPTATSLRTFTYKEMKIATKNFTDKLGSGSFGSVFKGTLPDNTLVAIKKLESSFQGEKQFRAEISTIGNIQHVNLVKLRGFCTEGSRRLLVYEYMPNGSLNLFLSRKSEGSEKVLDWKTRFEIALGIARGLVYLHDKCRDRIIHCDIKPENILLDADLSPKLADFGLAKLLGRDFSRVLTSARGTRGYLAPEWISGLPITVKADVYSFGMTLLEIISGRRNLDMSVQESRHYFPTWAATQIQKGNPMSLVDERLANKADVEEVTRAAMVSFLCIQYDENARPTMAEAVLMLEGKTVSDGNQFERSLQVLVDEHIDDKQSNSWKEIK